MTLRMETRVSGDVIILHCAGRLVFGDEAAAFRDRIKNILFGTHQIVVNLSGVLAAIMQRFYATIMQRGIRMDSKKTVQ